MAVTAKPGASNLHARMRGEAHATRACCLQKTSGLPLALPYGVETLTQSPHPSPKCSCSPRYAQPIPTPPRSLLIPTLLHP
eukprot:7159624-Pyramimonas_sp.AAC.1